MRIKFVQKIIDKIRNKQSTDYVSADNLKISMSNDCSYPQFCMDASLDDKLFQNFKRNKIYKRILEHVDKTLAEKYITEIKKNDANLLSEENLCEFRKNDSIGNAEILDFGCIKQISGSTIRYIHVLSEIKKYFKSLDNKTICEIGVGYGGQCRILSKYFSLAKYTLVDLKQVLCLCQKFLDNFALKTCVNYKTMNELSYNDNYDFVISNYAFSEISREFQQIYIDKIIKNSKSGFMIMNQITPENFNSFTKEELLSVIPNNPRVVEEIPLTNPYNYIIIWGENL